jgi:hypothetical protein
VLLKLRESDIDVPPEWLLGFGFAQSSIVVSDESPTDVYTSLSSPDLYVADDVQETAARLLRFAIAEGVREDAALDRQRLRQQINAVNKTTLQGHRVPFFKAFIWFKLRGKRFPPSSEDVQRLITLVNATARNKSAAPTIIQAINFVLGLNGFPPIGRDQGVRNLVASAQRAFTRPTKKAPALKFWMVEAIVRACCAPAVKAWARKIFATTLLAMWTMILRFSDACRLRWEAEFCQFFDTHCHFYLDYRKTDQVGRGAYIEVARKLRASRDDVIAWDIFARSSFECRGYGPVARNVSKAGRLAPPYHPDGNAQVMRLDWFNNMLRSELIACCGLPPDVARHYSSHSARSGATTHSVRSGIPENVIKQRAGVKGAEWLEGYDRIELDRRLECSAHLGL